MPSKLLLFTISSTIFDLAFGFFGPFWFLFLSHFGGGVEQFGYAISLMMAASAVTSYVAGHYSDRFGRKSFLIASGVGLASVIFGYTLVETAGQLYLLQVLYGVLISIQSTNEIAMLGDLTKDDTRGSTIGRIHFFTQLAAAGAVFVGGIIGPRIGVDAIFYITSVLMLCSVAILSQFGRQEGSDRGRVSI
jgi:DHA1 family multidrug resistance protein-like MFS transporter